MVEQNNHHPWRDLIQFFKQFRKDIIAIYFFAILGGLIQVSIPLGIQAIVGFSIGANFVTSIYVLIVLIILGVLMVGLMQIAQIRIIERIQQLIYTQNIFTLAEKIPRLNLYNYDNYYLPEKVNRIFETFNIQKGVQKILLDIPAATIQIVVGILVLCLYSSAFIGFGILLLAILWLIFKLTAKNGLRTALQESNEKYHTVSWLEEMGRVVMSFKFSHGTNFNLKKTDAFVGKYLDRRNEHFSILIIQYKALVVFKVILSAAMLIIGAILLVEQVLNIGEFIAAEIIILSVIGSVEKLLGSIDSVYDVATGVEKLKHFSDSAEDKTGQYKLAATKDGLEIVVKNLSFAYPNDKRVLDNISLNLPKNQISVLQGKTGTGKTTLFKILSTQYDTYEGDIMVDEINLRAISLKSLRQQMGLVLKQEELFEATLLENINLGNENISSNDVMDLIKELDFQDLLQNMENGFETLIDPAGQKLSSNKVSKIILLRALVKKPRIILLDETVLKLEKTELEVLQQYLVKIKQYTTIVIISVNPIFEGHAVNTINI
jgi:ATP-binding cassette, subfamily B, bacterial